MLPPPPTLQIPPIPLRTPHSATWVHLTGTEAIRGGMTMTTISGEVGIDAGPIVNVVGTLTVIVDAVTAIDHG